MYMYKNALFPFTFHYIEEEEKINIKDDNVNETILMFCYRYFISMFPHNRKT